MVMDIVQIAGRILVITLLAAGAAGAAPDSPDTLIHIVTAGDNLMSVCGEYRDRTGHYTLTDMLTDIRRANANETDLLSIGQRLRIPVCRDREVARVSEPVKSGGEVRGIYLTAPACATSSVFARVDQFIAAGGNAVVFDAKDIDGGVSFRSGHAMASWGEGRSAPLLPSLTELMKRFKKRDLYVVARLALFLDGELGRHHPELALQSPDGQPWSERGCFWVDPARAEVRDYNLTLAAELAAAGVDEIQFDYVRFPTNGWRGDWAGDLEATALRRREVIAGFLAEARTLLAPRGVRISADLYGIMAWGRVEDLALTGQHVPTFAEYVDVICPMIYPSHFRPGFEGRPRPGDDPAYFVGEGTRRFMELAGHQVEIRPWLQAFPYRVSRYDQDYVRVQVQASRTAGGSGWCLWNPSCRYTVALAALSDLCDEPVQVVASAASVPAPGGTVRGADPLPVTAASSSMIYMGVMASNDPGRTPND
ncbi:hypothetical protein DRQ50_01925 [bacterium]|nr:MAG: hypothetical protein DRQ50_01925 [bacterium]